MAQASKSRVLIVKTRDSAFYNPMVEGIIAGLKARGFRVGEQIDLIVIALVGKADEDTKQVHAQMSKHPQLVLAIGTDAALLAASEKTDIPALFGMVLDPISLGLVKSLDAPGGNWSGTTLLISPGKQLDTLTQAFPTAHKIGVLYTDQDATSLALLADAQRDAVRLHLEIVTLPAKHLDTPADDLALFKNIDAVWLIPDAASTGPKAFKSTLEYARANRLPILGASLAAVRAGATLALSAHLQDLGDVTADMASHILSGTETPAQMRVRSPRRTLLAVNLDAARALGLTIPDAMLHLADEVVDTPKDGK
jgi:putative tryptophan/tyrosine transport system substrate-binding protein